AAAAELRGDGVPLTARAQAIQDATQRAPIRHARSSALRALAALRNPAFDALPQRVGNLGKRGLHAPYRSRPPEPSNLSTGFDLPFLGANGAWPRGVRAAREFRSTAATVSSRTKTAPLAGAAAQGAS